MKKLKFSDSLNFDDDFKEHLKDPEFRAMYEIETLRLEISLALIALRKKRKMSQKSLAEKIGTSQSAIARLETGSKNITLETIGRIAGALHVKPKISFV